MAGRPKLSAADATERREEWQRAARYSGLRQAEIAHVVGVSLSTVQSYGWQRGNVPTQAAIQRLKDYNLARAVDVVRERFGGRRARGGRLMAPRKAP